ncbi:MAG: vitamin K epoxide reductase family protein [Streptosporangiaceae bacterium]
MAGQKPAGQRSGRSRQGTANTKGTAKPATARPGRAAVDQKPGTAKSPADPTAARSARTQADKKPGTAQRGQVVASGRAKARAGAANGAAKARSATGSASAARKASAGDSVQPRRRWFGLLGSMGGVPLATWILSLYGLGASIYLTLTHYDTHISLACSANSLVNCEAVTTSPQSMVFGVLPVALLGLLFYVFLAAINSPWAWRLTNPVVSWARLGSAIVGMGFVLYLIYAEVVQIGFICLWCTSVHVATFLIFALMVFYYTYTYSWAKPMGSGRA